MLCSFSLAIFHAAFVFSLAGLSGIARCAGVPLLTTLFATVRLLCLCSVKSAKNDQYQCCDAHFIALLFASAGPLRPLMSNFTVQMIGIPPPDGVHKRIDVTGGLGAEIHVIGMLVHIERQNR